MKLVMENVVEYTEYMLREYYHLNIDPFFSVLDTDIMWIGPGNLFVFGEMAVKSYFKDGFIMPNIEMENTEFYELQPEKDSSIVVGRFSCHTEQDADKVAAANQRVTIHFRQYSEKKSVKITHMHVSNEWNELVDDEVFPFKVSVQTYRYVQKLVTESGVKKWYKKIELRNDMGLQYIDPNMVVYAEAIGKYTVVHFVDKIVTIKRLIGDVALLFPEIFCRPHRGYLVNCEFIVSVERYRITMVTGTMIPIPEKRYFKVREEIAAIMRKV
ncbi:lytTr DNA-binding domain protein [Clostridioides difficile CD160]|nr:lytTr DNA-binding domain protein [Clostridioides difficile CD160]